MRFRPVLLCLLVPLLAEAQIYRVTMPDGSIVFTDSPPENAVAEEVELPDIIIQPAIQVPARESPAATTPAVQVPIPEIVQPFEQQVIPPGQRQLIVAAQVDRGLPVGHQFQLLLNGSPQGLPVDLARWVIDNPNPGEQRAEVAIVDAQGRRLAVSTTRIFYVIR